MYLCAYEHLFCKKVKSIDHRIKGLEVVLLSQYLLCARPSARHIAEYKLNEFVKQIWLSPFKSL